MELKYAIQAINVLVEDKGSSRKKDAWATIRKALVETQKLLCDIKMLSEQSGFADDQRLSNIRNYIMQL